MSKVEKGKIYSFKLTDAKIAFYGEGQVKVVDYAFMETNNGMWRKGDCIVTVTYIKEDGTEGLSIRLALNHQIKLSSAD
jgi:hypothetical protein